jgi:HD-GYP domain-containing protein (c-di-GMP phosphodiesterase class II)
MSWRSVADHMGVKPVFDRFRSRPQGPPIVQDDGATPTVLATRSSADLQAVQGEILREDAAIAELLLNLVRETATARNDQSRLLEVIGNFAFQAFPNATHHILAVRDEIDTDYRPLIARSRSGGEPTIALSRTIVSRVLKEGVAVLWTLGQEGNAEVASIALSGLQTAMCAPLINQGETFGVIQLDIRRPGKGMFTRKDLDLLSVFASQVSLTLDHLHLYHQQRRAFQSTMSALVHSLTLKDPATAEHSERVQEVALEIGRQLGLPDPELEVLGVAALLHDLGKQGVRDELLFKPEGLSESEREEMARHAAHTQAILDKIVYPEHLREVPVIAAYHHEKMDGTGPFQIAARNIPRASRIISVADVFDALMSPRAYKAPLKVDEVVAILEEGKGKNWDPEVVKALREVIPDLEATVYAPRTEPGDRPGLDLAA